MDVIVGLWRKLRAEELMLLNLDCKDIKQVNPKRNQSWISIGRIDAEAEAPILWLPDAKNWLAGKDPDAGKDWRQQEKQTTEDEMVGWHHWLNGYEFEKALGVGDRQGSLVCFSPFGYPKGPQTWNCHYANTSFSCFLCLPSELKNSKTISPILIIE